MESCVLLSLITYAFECCCSSCHFTAMRNPQFMAKKQRENAELGMVAVAQDFNALQYVAQKVRHNREVLACGIAQDGRALQYAAGNLRKDKELAAYAVGNNGLALQVRF